MNITHTEESRAAFWQYIRKGTPIRLSFKNERPTARYVWRTRGDGKVRVTHAENDGHVFSGDNPPATGHPGEDYNCRCEAVPYRQGGTEYAAHGISIGLASSYDRWENIDFVSHFYLEEGRGVTLSEIGHLREIVEQHAYYDDGEGAFRRLSDQIADRARKP